MSVETRSKTILIVEDEAALSRLMRKMLEKQGYAVLEAGSARVALELSGRPEVIIDLVITDIMMPEMTGQELAEELSRAHPRLQVLFMSGYARVDIEQQGLLSPDQPFLPKPFNIKRLSEAIDDLLGAEIQGGATH